MRPSPTYLNSPRNVSGNATVKGALSSRILLSVSRVATCDQAKRYSLWNTVYTAAEQSEGHPGSCNRIQIPNIFQSKQQWGNLISYPHLIKTYMRLPIICFSMTKLIRYSFYLLS